MDVSVKITGLRELSAAFKRIDTDLPKELQAELKKVAEHVVGATQQRMPHRTGRAQRSVKARASTRGASIAAYGTAAPYGHWLDFGGSVGRGHVPGVPWSGAIKREWRGVPRGSGRYLYPAIAESRDAIEEDVDDAVAKVAKRAGFETKGGL